MGSPLFEFDDEFIDSVCYGRSDEETTERFVAALNEGRSILAERVQQSMRNHPSTRGFDPFQVEWDGEGLVIVPPEGREDEALDLEYGLSGEAPLGIMRSAVNQSRVEMERAISAELEME